MINWKVRFKSRAFWFAMIPALFLLVQTGAAIGGVQLDLSELQQRILDFVNAVFIVLTIAGIVADPTTDGWADSSLAMTYDAPRVPDAWIDSQLVAVLAPAEEDEE